MDAKEFRKKESWSKADFFTDDGNIDLKLVEEFAESYHQAKVNNVVLDDVMVCEYCNNIGEKSKKLGRVLCDNCFDIAISKL